MKNRNFYLVFPVLLCCACFTNFVSAQLTLVNSEPAHGAVHVDPDTSLSVTFSEAIDTTADFDGFYLAIEIHPEDKISETDDIIISGDGKTITVNGLNLQPDTQYLVFLTGAVSMDGDSLDRPYVLNFTTANALAPNKVEGQVLYAGGDPTHTVVGLIDVNSENFELSAASVALEADGSFSIPYVAAGDYYLIASKDANKNGLINLEPGDLMGSYDPDQNGIMDVISVAGDVTGIQINLGEFLPQAAGAYYEAAKVLALDWAADARFVMTMSEELDETGKSLQWIYLFYSPARELICMISNFGTNLLVVEEDETDAVFLPIPEGWIDSDAAFAVAETNGGADFRTADPNCEIVAILGISIGGIFGDDEDVGLDKAAYRPHSILAHHRIGPAGFCFNNSLKQMDNGAEPYWFFNYYSNETGDELDLFVNALDGAIFNAWTARDAADAADSYEAEIESDAALCNVYAFDVNEQGKSDNWLLLYYSASTDMTYNYLSFGPFIVAAGQDTPEEPLLPLPDDWKDSDEIFQIAEDTGGEDFRSQYADWEGTMVLGRNVTDFIFALIKENNSGRRHDARSDSPDFSSASKSGIDLPAIWGVFLESESGDTERTFFIDAVTGEVFGPVTAQEAVAAGSDALAEAPDDLAIFDATCDQTHVQSLDDFGENWDCSYYSPSTGELYNLYVYNGIVLSSSTFAAPQNYPILQDGWMDSDDALQIAESRGGQNFRATHEDVDIYGNLSSGIEMSGEEYEGMGLWYFNYSSGDNSLMVVFDAYTGEEFTSVAKDAVNPTQFSLSQNYPNPFNPETEVTYSVPVKGPVSVRILDLRGREVTELYDSIREPGRYSMRWDGTDRRNRPVPSGIYLMQLQSGSNRLCRKMTLIR